MIEGFIIMLVASVIGVLCGIWVVNDPDLKSKDNSK